MEFDDRLTRMEEQSFFMDKLLSELNEALAAQQKQLDTLEKRLDILEMEVKEWMNETRGDPQNSAPPHYSPRSFSL